MDFDRFIETAWSDHADQPEAVAQRLAGAVEDLQTPAQAAALARLATHVFGEHLGRSEDGLRVLAAIRLQLETFAPSAEANAALARGIAVLRALGGDDSDWKQAEPEERIAILATLAAARVGRGQIEAAMKNLAAAEALADRTVLTPGSAAHRALAVAGNNMAAGLSERSELGPAETATMIAAARTGLAHWRIAGGWLEEARAHHRLGTCLLKAGDAAAALEQAERCRAVCEANGAPAFELFFAHALLALVQHALNDRAGFEAARAAALRWHQALDDDDRRWCETEITQLDAAAADLR